jgi:cobalamin biosynthesis protein CobT
MKDNLYDRYVKGFRSGKLHGRSLYKTMVGSDRIFQRKQEQLHKKYNVVILLDESGSMLYDLVGNRRKEKYSLSSYYSEDPLELQDPPHSFESRIETAAELASHLIMALEKNGITYSVIGFHEKITVHKNIDKRLKTRLQHRMRNEIINRCIEKEYGGCNHDFMAVNAAYNILSKKHEGSNITFILSDGRPECSCGADIGHAKKVHPKVNSYEINDYLKLEVARLEKVSEVLSVGIGRGGGRDFYPNFIPIQTKEEFYEAVLKRLSKRISRG